VVDASLQHDIDFRPALEIENQLAVVDHDQLDAVTFSELTEK
jgi:hypothetical protein